MRDYFHRVILSEAKNLVVDDVRGRINHCVILNEA